MAFQRSPSFGALGLAAALAAGSAQAQSGRWVEHGRDSMFLVAVDRQTLVFGDGGVQLRALTVFAQPVELPNGRKIDHAVAQLALSCPPRTVHRQHEWHYEADGTLIQQGPGGRGVEPVQPQDTIFRGLAEDLCDGSVSLEGASVWDTELAAAAEFHRARR